MGSVCTEETPAEVRFEDREEWARREGRDVRLPRGK